MSGWGKNRGCGFFNTKCMSTAPAPNFPEFCTGVTQRGCSFNGYDKGVCGGTSSIRTGTVDYYFNYWGNNTVTLDNYADNCPYVYPWSDGNCEDISNAKTAMRGEYFGLGSRCFDSKFKYGVAPSTNIQWCLKNTVKFTDQYVNRIV